MSGVATLCIILLAVIFAWSALAKLRRPGATVAAFTELRLPIARVAARLVPLVEIGLVVVLLAAPRFGAALAIVLLISFTLVLLPTVIASTSAVAPVSCGCFGTASTAPISWVEIARNGLLISASLVAALASPSSLLPGIDGLELPDVVAMSSAIIVSAVVLQLLAMKRDIGSIWRADLVGEDSDTIALQGGTLS